MREIKFYHLDNGKCPVEDFLETLSSKEVEKVFFVFELIETIKFVPRKFFKKLTSTANIWEVRVSYNSKFFRLLGFLDGDDLVILNHAFTKKTQKTPKKDIKKAEQRKNNYFQRS
jgi:phage-related protein